jgi:hypothetical protein
MIRSEFMDYFFLGDPTLGKDLTSFGLSPWVGGRSALARRSRIFFLGFYKVKY